MAAITPTGGASGILNGGLNAVPSPTKSAISANYLDFSGSSNDWSQQYVPDLIEQEAEVFGNRTISGFLSQVGAEESMSSDQIVWSEQGRLHLSYKISGEASNVLTLSGAVGTTDTGTSHSIRVGQTVLVSDGASSPTVFRGYVSACNATNELTVLPYSTNLITNVSGISISSLEGSGRIFVYGSEFAKGTQGISQGTNSGDPVEPSFKSYKNKPVIIKDHYSVSGSDTASIGWVEVSVEDGTTGYLWYLKGEAECRQRFNDHIEMAMLEAEPSHADSTIALPTDGGAGTAGSEGLFYAIKTRGHYTSGIGGTAASDDLGSFDEILKKLDGQGAIEENMMYVNRNLSLAIDDMLASQNSYGAGGTSYGVFNNSEDMALNLGFSGFRRGSYDFYKSDWKYLNDATLRGQAAFTDVRGVIIPAGVSNVYDQNLGKNMRRPFLHVRYRASDIDNRKLKSWITGSVGGNVTSDLDAMEVQYLSERCLVVQGGNNFMVLN